MWLLSERNIMAIIKSYESDQYDINMGTPQGSVTALLIFVLLINSTVARGSNHSDASNGDLWVITADLP